MYCHMLYKIIVVLSCVDFALSFTKPRGEAFNGFNNQGLDGILNDEPSLEDIYDPVHGVKMGIPQSQCDDGIHGIERDWDPNSSEEYTCYYGDYISFHQKPKDIVDKRNLMVKHICLNESIIYDDNLPLNGDHRPLWPQFGEYLYLPPQRWVHSLEHGAIVLLYHPCMIASQQLTALKSIVRRCLGKHVISPYRNIPNYMKNALKAPESHVTDDGQYRVELLTNATVYSDLNTDKKDVCAYLK
ncbi:hypothetical protein ACF0H5_017280 [Mactra antiquata]